MDIPISDLLDGLQDVALDIPPKVSVPVERIEELTMKKLHKYERKRGRGLSFVTKVLVAAIVITTLAIPVMAIGGMTFQDWLIGPETETLPRPEPEEKVWIGDVNFVTAPISDYYYFISTNVTESDATGLTLTCQECSTVEPIGTLSVSAGYWLEKKVGSEYQPLDGKLNDTQQIPVENDADLRWEINWEDTYGTLESGAYIICKVYTYTSPEGNTEQYTLCAPFRIFTGEMGPYVTQANTALETLLNQHSFHLTATDRPTNNLEYEYYTTEVWKYGDNYLSESRYVKEDGTLWACRGSMILDGVGYNLEWSGDTVTSEIAMWEKADYMDPGNFAIWAPFLEIGNDLGQIYVEDSSIYFYTYDNWLDETTLTQERIDDLNRNNPTWNHDYMEVAYHLDDTGAIEKITHSYLHSLDPATADPFVDMTVEVHDTDPEEIAAIIHMQDVSKPNKFSWEADLTGHYTKLAQFEGFVNTSPGSAISTPAEAIERARAEAIAEENPKYRDGCVYNMTNVWFDPDAGIWKVRFYYSQNSYFQTIIWMDGEGITRMKSLSSYEEFD